MPDRETRRLSFGSVATDYDRYRPSPPPQALDWLIPPGARAPWVTEFNQLARGSREADRRPDGAPASSPRAAGPGR